MHEREYPIMILLQCAPRIILDHFGLETSSWNDKVLTKLQSDGASEYRRNPAHILFSSPIGITTPLKNMEIVQPFEPSMIRCKFGIGVDHVKDGKLEKGDIAQEQKTQINHVNALKMDATNLHDKSEHGNMHICTKAVVWGLFEVLTPAIVRYQSLYKEKLNAYIINDANFVAKPEHECH